MRWEILQKICRLQATNDWGFKKLTRTCSVTTRDLTRKEISFFYIHNPWNTILGPIIRDRANDFDSFEQAQHWLRLRNSCGTQDGKAYLLVLSRYCIFTSFGSIDETIPLNNLSLSVTLAVTYWRIGYLSSGLHKIPRILFNPNVYYRLHESPLPLLIASQIYLVHASNPLIECPF